MSYKIISLHAENVKKLKCVDITPDPNNNTVIISGKNGQGKTSVLDSIYWALAGGNNIQGKPIREGEEKAVIKIDLGEYQIKRSFTDKGTYLTLTNSDGFKTSSPQVMLDNLMGSITFDPLAFTRMDQKKQYTTLQGLVEMDIDLEDVDEKIQFCFNNRTTINREVKGLKAQIESYDIPEDTPDNPIDVQQLSEDIGKINHAIYNDAANAIEIIDTKAIIENLEKTLSEHRDILKTLQGKVLVDKDGAEERLEILKAQMSTATDVNTKISEKKQLLGIKSLYDLRVDKSKGLTESIDKLEKSKKDALEKAKFPIDGLSFEDGEVIFDGVPFSQSSNAEQIRVSTAIAMAMNPKIRVIRIKDGSLLDEESMKSLQSMAKEHDFQIWMEVVSSDDPTAIVLEEGEIKTS